MGAAVHRAAHQLLEGGRVFSDPLALRILGPGAEAVRAAAQDPARTGLRLFIAFRSRFAEEALERVFARGVRQLVVLGAGLDTYAYRNPLGPDLRIFEVDHPATQAWKRRRLAETGIPVPGNLAYVPVDFQRDDLAACLAAAGFDGARASFFSWLGVVPYLSEAAVFAILAGIAALPGGAHVVFDYGNPAGAGDGGREELARRVAAVGETLRSHFETEDLHARLAAAGFLTIEDLGPAGMRERFLPGRAGTGPDRGGHVLFASTG
jgi:methyltransferase (TIGR00027 family)